VSFIEVPVAYDAVTIVVHPQNNWATSMTMAELKRLWEPAAEGKVMRWRDVRAGWPDEPIRLFGPGALSGTFDFFTETVNGTLDASRQDYTASEDDTVIVNGVAADRLALGYVGYGYVEQNKNALRAVAIAGAHAERLGAVMPSPDNVQRGAYAPLARTLFIYVNANAMQRPEVSQFVDFYLEQDEDLVRSVGGIAMSHRAYELVRTRVAKRVAGSLFAQNRPTDNLEMLLAASVGAEPSTPSR
jgi:phosphate transport system substrate-binding protein